MTALGKILVFFNLVFSLVVGAFAVMDYSARTHYAKGLADLDNGITVLTAVRDAYKKEADDNLKKLKDIDDAIRSDAGKLVEIKDTDRPAAVLIGAVQKGQEQVRKLAADLEKVRLERQDWKDKHDKAVAVATGSQQDALRHENEVKQIRKALDAQIKENERLLTDMKAARDEKVKALIERQTALDRATELFGELKDYKDRLKQATSRGTLAGKRPPDNVEGLVTRAEGNLVTITIGSDAGLTRGHELQVFRLGTTPRYLGTLKLITVTRDQAVGEIVGRPRAPIQRNDRVATSILGGS